MSSRSYSESDLLRAVEESKGGLSYRKAAARYGVPKSTVCDHATGKVSGSKRGPPTVLNQAEEQMLVDWALHMADIGYGRTREQLCATVKEILDKDGRENPFTDNCPGEQGLEGEDLPYMGKS